MSSSNREGGHDPEAAVTLDGLYDVMNAVTMMGQTKTAPFTIEIVGEKTGPLLPASGVPIDVQRAVDGIEASDIVIVPSLPPPPGPWVKARHPELVNWLARMHFCIPDFARP